MNKNLLKIICLVPALSLTSCSSKLKTIDVKMSEQSQRVLDAYGFTARNSLNETYWHLWEEELLVRKSGYVDMVTTTTDSSGKVVPLDFQTNYSIKYKDMEYISSFTPKTGDYNKIIMYVHGGAFITEALASHATYCDNLAYLNNALVVVPNYPLAPQACYIEAYEMLNSLYSEISKENKPIYIFGDSAGGGLALSYTLYLKDQKKALPKKVVAISPWVDLATNNPDIYGQIETDRMLHPFGLQVAGKWWAGDLPNDDSNKLELNNYLVSPIYGNYKGFPETLVFASTYEIFYPDLMKFVNKLEESKVKTTLVNLEGFMHVAPIVQHFSEYNDLLGIVGDFIK